MCDPTKDTYELILEHLRINRISTASPKWVLKESPLGGRGLFSACNIKPGEVIFVDYPIIMGPRAGLDIPQRCVTCYKKDTFRMCSKQCGLIVCGIECESSDQHTWECNRISNWKKDLTNLGNITRYLSPIRALRLNSCQTDLMKHLKSHCAPQHGFEVDCLKDAGLMISPDEEILMKFASSVMDANAFEIVMGDEDNKTSFRGLYPLSGLANHRCYPNAMHIFDENQRMVVKASSAILKGEEIFHSYSRITWNTLTRRYHLVRTKHFLCNCLRCEDATEFGTNLSALYCDICRGMVLPLEPLNFKTEWECKSCGRKKSNREIAFVLSVFGSRLGSFTDNDVDDMICFVNRNQLPGYNHIIVELKLKLIWTLGHKDGYFWEDLAEKYLILKDEMCRDILQLLDSLKTGYCKMRGLLLYELVCCLRERRRRVNMVQQNNYEDVEIYNSNIEQYLNELKIILKFDVGAPKEIKNSFNGNVIKFE